jgi:hypothetical protein
MIFRSEEAGVQNAASNLGYVCLKINFALGCQNPISAINLNLKGENCQYTFSSHPIFISSPFLVFHLLLF